ncbi:MAG: hypothetical protein LBI26_02820 [Holosporales bacterium]|jgi:hypothetical protein|nr:hypothetical protein [Holosporales bacterium]
MIEKQLVCRGIDNPLILAAFQLLDRSNFIKTKWQRCAFSDIDLPLKEKEIFMIKSYSMAKMLTKILKIKHDNILIVEDASGFTSAVFKYVFNESNCLSETINNLFTEKDTKFDVIFLDSFLYYEETIEKSKELLTKNGTIFYLKGSNEENEFFFRLRREITLEVVAEIVE